MYFRARKQKENIGGLLGPTAVMVVKCSLNVPETELDLTCVLIALDRGSKPTSSG